MSKREFLSKLEEALVYEMPPRAVTENLRYYSSYIDSEKGKGRSEEEVLDELGDPRLIARTIIEAEKSGEDGIPGTADDVVWQETPYSARMTGYDRGTESSDRETGREDYNADPEENRERRGFGTHMSIHTYSGCMPCLVGLMIALFIMSIFMGAISLMMPILPVIAVIALIWWLLGKVGKS